MNRRSCTYAKACSYKVGCPTALGAHEMPTLFRFMFICATIAALIYGAMQALVVFVEPRERDVTVRIPSERVNPPQP